jgi:hypothetical protein
MIIQCLTENKHHTDPAAAEMVCAALVWMTATSDLGPSVLPFIRAGDMTIIYENHAHQRRAVQLPHPFRREDKSSAGALKLAAKSRFSVRPCWRPL